MIYIGIDNGIGGGLAAYRPEDNWLDVIAMPTVSVKKAKGNKNEYNIPAIVSWFRTKAEAGIGLVVLERAQAFPGQGVVSMFNIGKGYGIMEGILSALNIPYTIVAPKTWQKQAFAGLAHEDTKQASILVAQRLFPTAQFIASPLARKLHNGMTDAALMAYHAYSLRGIRA